MIRTTACIVAALSLAACSAEPPAGAANDTAAARPVGSLGGVDPTAATAGATPPPARGLPETPEPHAAPALQPMERADFESRELLGSGCAFHAGPRAPILLMVRDEGDGLVKFDKRLRRITAATPGRDAIQAGGILAGDGVSFTIARQQGDGEQASTSSRQWPATLTMRTADGGERQVRGNWECGS